MTVDQVARLLMVSDGTVRRWIRTQKLAAKLTPGGQQFRILPADLARAFGIPLPELLELAHEKRALLREPENHYDHP